jgi:hypothetical protein
MPAIVGTRHSSTASVPSCPFPLVLFGWCVHAAAGGLALLPLRQSGALPWLELAMCASLPRRQQMLHILLSSLPAEGVIAIAVASGNGQVGRGSLTRFCLLLRTLRPCLTFCLSFCCCAGDCPGLCAVSREREGQARIPASALSPHRPDSTPRSSVAPVRAQASGTGAQAAAQAISEAQVRGQGQGLAASGHLLHHRVLDSVLFLSLPLIALLALAPPGHPLFRRAATPTR